MDIKDSVKNIEGYNGLYVINSNGTIIRTDKNNIVNQHKHNRGYLYVTLYSNNKAKNYLVHRLLAINFIPNEYNKPFINHKDGNKANNNLNNLEWCTHKENMQHAYDIGIHKPHRKKCNQGMKSPNAKINDAQVIEIFNSKGTQKSIAIKYGISQTQVFRIKHKLRWNHING